MGLVRLWEAGIRNPDTVVQSSGGMLISIVQTSIL